MEVDDDKRDKMEAQACATIWLCLSNQIIYYGMDKTSPKDIWDILEDQFISKTLIRKLYREHKLYGSKMHVGRISLSILMSFSQVTADLGKVDAKINDEDMAIIVLCLLPGSCEKKDVKVDDIVAALLAHEQRRKNNLS